MTQQHLTPYQSQYYPWLLIPRAASDTLESLASTLMDLQVDLNQHQVDAALFMVLKAGRLRLAEQPNGMVKYEQRI